MEVFRYGLTVVLAGLLAPSALLPPLICLLGMSQGGDRGTAWGLFGGGLCFLAGFSPWSLLFCTLLGAFSGVVFHNSRGVWGKCGLAIPPLMAFAALPMLFHWLSGAPLAGVLPLAGTTLLLSLAGYPLAYALWRAASFRPKRRSL